MKIIIFLLINCTTLGYCDLYFDRFNVTAIPSSRKASDTFVKAFNLVVPTGVGNIRNHIIPASLFNSLYVKLFESAESREALVRILRDSMSFFKTKIQDKLQPNADGDIITKMMENMENTIDCLDESNPTIVANGVELTGEDLVNYCCYGLNDLRALFEWNPGNLFLGPKNRLVDGGPYRDIEARHIFPYEIYSMNSAYYNVIINYLDVGDVKLLNDLISYNRRLLDTSDEMAEIARQAIWININPADYVRSMMYHVPEQYSDAMEQIRISKDTKLMAIYNLEKIVNMENIKTKNKIYKEILEEQLAEIYDKTANRFHDIPRVLLEDYARDPYSETFHRSCSIFFEKIRIYFQPKLVVQEAKFNKISSLIVMDTIANNLDEINNKIKRNESINTEISNIVDKFAEVTNCTLEHVVRRIEAGYKYQWANTPSPHIQREGTSGIYRDFPAESQCASSSDQKPKQRPSQSKKHKQPPTEKPKKIILKSVVSREQKLKNIKLSVERRVVNVMRTWSPCLTEESVLGLIQITIELVLWRVMLDPIRDYHLTDFRLSVEYDNYERHAVSLESVLKDSCTINPKYQYHTWTDHLNSNPQLDNVQNMGFSQFADGSYAQQLVSNDSALDPVSWRAVDLSFYIGLAAPLITNRMRRGTELVRPRQKLTHGLLYVDRYNRPVMALFRVSYSAIKSLYWTNGGWTSKPKNPFTNNTQLSLASVDSDTFVRCDGIPVQHSNITSAMRLTDEMLLREANLAIVQREFTRTVNGDGFYYKKYPSWKEQYETYSWSSIRDQGEVMSGNAFKIWALGGFRFRHLNYGYYFSDGSFSVGLSSKTIQNDDTDNWLSEAGRSRGDWNDTNYHGQIFFDSNGRPVAIAIMAPYCFFQRCTWVFEYTDDNTWKWVANEWEPWNDQSRNSNSFTFIKNNVNY